MKLKMKPNHNEEHKTSKELAKTALEYLITEITPKKTEDARLCISNLSKLNLLIETSDGDVAKFALKLRADFDKTRSLSDIKLMVLNLQVEEFLKKRK
jgi:hypothetical protein